MASADFYRFSYTLLHRLSLWELHPSCRRYTSRPPRVRTIAFIPSTRRIYCIGFGQCWTLSCVADSSALIQPHMRFLFIGPGLCLRLPSDSTSRWTPLPSANGSHCQAHSGLSPPSYRPCRAHHHRRGLDISSRPRTLFKIWSRQEDLNPQHADYDSAALPFELCRHCA